jgi:large subunit ribosomal protein L22
MAYELAGPGIRKIVRRGTEKAPFKRVSVETSGRVAVVNVHTVRPDTFQSRRGADLIPELEKALNRTVTIDVKPEAQAVHKFVRLSPTKARRVMNVVRGKYVDEALAILQFMPNRAARYVEKLIRSAAANAFEGWGADPSELKVVWLIADAGPTMKRIKPRAMGRAYRILKRSSHISVAVQAADPRPLKGGAARRQRGRAAVTRATNRPQAGGHTHTHDGDEGHTHTHD